MTQDFDTALEGFKAAYTKLVQDEHDQMTQGLRTHGYSEVNDFVFEHESGPKYVRVLQRRLHGNSRSVYAFVRKADGAIMYPAGWRGPVTKPHGVRGSIYAADFGISCCGPYGMKTLR